MIGATIVSIGTTLPEVTVSSLASASSFPDIAYGNAVGSVICNTGLIAGSLLLLRPTNTNRDEIASGALFFFASAAAFTLVSVRLGVFSRGAGILLIALFVAYMALPPGRRCVRRPQGRMRKARK